MNREAEKFSILNLWNAELFVIRGGRITLQLIQRDRIFKRQLILIAH